ncbi:MAG TPA: UDP-N-acetylmuramoyl-L-alanine--D-glutamate ligase [Bacteroidales bacterium]|nr:UDP-N-acetylmuramoyl-L-alanine--D-glutamate ligase [Bacteroidales bacterium]HPS51334.1 UDP-N-acetylmuramoyl-L-alanine--D-glutamate ligase [Bacteroidales bacterium]
MTEEKKNVLFELIRSKFEGKSVVLLGFGREGQATYRVIRGILPLMKLTIADVNDHIKTNPLLVADPNVNFVTGPGYLDQLSTFDIIVRSPGIVIWPFVGDQAHDVSIPERRHPDESAATTTPIPDLATDPVFRHLIRRDQITSQTDLFLQAYGSQVIGVTGTKGKSTTAALICHILKTAGYDAILAGNIGNPVFHFAGAITPETIIVFELSSHQLEYLTRGPHIAVLLNLFQEHLDAYSSFESYQQAKLNIARRQVPGDFLVFNDADPLVAKHVALSGPASDAIGFSADRELPRGSFIRDGWIWYADRQGTKPVWKIHQDRFLRGDHNLKNIMAAITVARILGIGDEDIEDGIGTFKGLEHRLEYVGEFGGIHFYNDSIATIPEACMEAVKAIPAVDTLVAGGFDRGIDYSGLSDFLATSAIRNLILVGAAGKRIGKGMEKAGIRNKKLFYINRFDDFCAIAFRETRPGHVCLLSPAAASYDEFSNFEERGKRFRDLAGGNASR